MNQTSAQDHCKSLHGRAQLAEIKTQGIEEFVEGLDGSNLYLWLGGNDKAQV